MTIRPVVSSLCGAGAPPALPPRLPRLFGLELDTASFYPRMGSFCDLGVLCGLRFFAEVFAAKVAKNSIRAFSESQRLPADSRRAPQECHCSPWGEIPHSPMRPAVQAAGHSSGLADGPWRSLAPQRGPSSKKNGNCVWGHCRCAPQSGFPG